jgi:hypothetical protein
MDYIIQMRVTRTHDKHVCRVCGKDAYLRGVGYEATSQELADQFNEELQRAETLEQMRKSALTSKVSDAIFDATVEEQRVNGPQEHERFYQCVSCLGTLLSSIMGNESVYSVIAALLKKPASHALFCARNIDIPDQCMLVIGPNHAPLLALEALRDKNVPHFDTSSGMR